MASRLNSGTFLAIAALSMGCVTFEQQTVSYQHDEAGDRLLVHIVYSGIHGDSAFTPTVRLPAMDLTGAEKADLVEVVRGSQVYLFDNWLPIVDLDALCVVLGEPIDPYASEAARSAGVALRDWWTLLAANVEISNGPFYINGTGRLSAVQHITISHLSAVVTSANRAWSQQAETWLSSEPEWEVAARIVQPAQLNGNQLVLRYPAGDEPTGERRWLDAGVLSIVDGIATLTLGSPTTPRVTFVTPLANHYVPNAVGFVRQRFGLLEHFDPKADADVFFAGTRR
jgi:hypothetical protein